MKWINWIVENKAWLFSGILIAIPLAIFGWIVGKRAITHKQKQRGGNGSVNIQADGNIIGNKINIDSGKNNDKAGPSKRR